MNTTYVLDRILSFFDRMLISILGNRENLEYFGRYRGHKIFLHTDKANNYYEAKVLFGRNATFKFIQESNEEILNAVKQLIDKKSDRNSRADNHLPLASLGLKVGTIAFYFGIISIFFFANFPPTRDEPYKYLGMALSALGLVLITQSITHLTEEISLIRDFIRNGIIHAIAYGFVLSMLRLLLTYLKVDFSLSIIEFAMIGTLIGFFSGSMTTIPIDEWMRIIRIKNQFH